jgi:hypothetical protein
VGETAESGVRAASGMAWVLLREYQPVSALVLV